MALSYLYVASRAFDKDAIDGLVRAMISSIEGSIKGAMKGARLEKHSKRWAFN